MPRVKSVPVRRRGGGVTTVSGRRALKRYGYKKYGMRKVARPMRSIATNTASVKEAITIACNDGQAIYFRNWQLADLSFDRAQQVAAAYQEFRIKYIKFTFQPSADTFTPAPGNTIPQLYFMVDKLNAVPALVSLSDFKDMGARPHRFDDRNKVVAFRPSVLVADYTAAGVVTASQMKISPWLSTNANSGNPGAVWAPSEVDHTGLVCFVTKPGAAAPTIQYNVDIELVFQFRKPLWKAGNQPVPPSLVYNGAGGFTEITDNHPVS